MRSPRRLALTTLILVLPALAGFTALDNAMKLQPRSRLWIDGTSTVRSFTCRAGSLEADVETTSFTPAAELLAGTKAVTGVRVRVPAARLDCGNGRMNDHMLKALKAAEHPMIGFRLSTYELAPVTDSVQVTLNGELELGGQTKTIQMKTMASEVEDGVLRVAGTHEIRMSEFGLKAPTLMLGTLKVNEKVKVGFELYLER